MFESLSEKLQGIFNQLGKRGVLREEDIKAVLREIRLALLEADVNYKVVKDFIARVRVKAVGEEVSRALNPSQQVIKIVHQELITTLGAPGRLELEGRAPYVLMLVGLQGSGKTTMAAKLALHLRSRGHFPLMVAADVYRPAAIKQLEVLGNQLNVPVYSERDTKNPPLICEHSVEYARQRGSDIIILDTAGRLQIDDEMMAELETVRDRVKPVEVLLVADAMTGQEAVNIAQGFNERIGGEKPNALEIFHPERLASRILGMGDMLSLIERAESAFSAEQASQMEQKLRKGDFDMEDFLEQLRQVRKMGPLNEILGMIPGMGRKLKGVEFDQAQTEKSLKSVEAIILSMTLKERRNPRILNAKRKRRVAAGSGTSVQQVNQLISQYRQMQRMIKQINEGKMRGLPRMF